MVELLKNQAVFSFLLALVVLGVMLTAVAICIYFERKISAWIQDREGPNRVGLPDAISRFHFWGFGQPIADGLKFLLKEDIIPAKVDKPLYLLAPAISLVVALIGFVVVPWGGQLQWGATTLNVQVADPGIGLLYILAVGSMSVYGVVLGGWASNNKYSMYGAVRATAQMLSYEIPMGVAILVVVLTTGSIRLEEIVLAQVGAGHIWLAALHPIAFIILVICTFAETNRAPFDLAEAEQELVGGFHTEYSSMKFAMFFLGEYAHMITASAVISVLFLGGWHLPWIPGLQPGDTGWLAVLLKITVLCAKITAFIFLFMWVRWTLPRFRFDQLMRLAWQGLIPLSLGSLVVAIGGLYFGVQDRLVFMLPANLLVAAVALAVSAASPTTLTGRQANMPPVAGSAGAPGT